jgi:hypothetical protein
MVGPKKWGQGCRGLLQQTVRGFFRGGADTFLGHVFQRINTHISKVKAGCGCIVRASPYQAVATTLYQLAPFGVNVAAVLESRKCCVAGQQMEAVLLS